MPQVDLESLVCGVAGAGAGDRKVSCETVIAAGESGDSSPPRMPPPPPPDPDFPPESITIPIGDEVAFPELNPIYDRDDSTKGSTNPKSAAGAPSNPIPAKSRSNSTRIAGAPAAATTFFGLPASIRPVFTRRRPSQGRILPDKRSGGGGSSRRGDGEEEPRSPKVSCIGKVLSDRERYGRSRGRRWWRGLVAVFLCGGGCSCQGGGGRHARKKVALDEDHDGDDDKQQGIAAMRRFKSGRRTASWVEEAIAATEAAGEEQQQQENDDGDDEKKQEVEHYEPTTLSSGPHDR